jgi:hypothetical protein
MQVDDCMPRGSDEIDEHTAASSSLRSFIHLFVHVNYPSLHCTYQVDDCVSRRTHGINEHTAASGHTCESKSGKGGCGGVTVVFSHVSRRSNAVRRGSRRRQRQQRQRRRIDNIGIDIIVVVVVIGGLIVGRGCRRLVRKNALPHRRPRLFPCARAHTLHRLC